MTAPFHNVRFPVALSYGATGGPETRTEIITSRSGAEERNAPWAAPRRRYDAGISLRSLDDLDRVLAFFNARHGRLHAFRWKDWGDYKSCAPSANIASGDQRIADGDGLSTEFQLVKNYTTRKFAETEFVRVIKKPVENTVSIAIGGLETLPGQDFTVDHETGIITFTTPPPDGEPITAGYEFDVPARFDTDYLPISIASFQAGQITSIPVIEVKI